MRTADAVLQAAAALRDAVESMRFAAPVTHVYDPLVYAWELYHAYVRRYLGGPRRVVFLGMNPGPFGMAQTGVPFGEVAMVRDWLGLDGHVAQPSAPHPRRPVTGLACQRSEVSGRRLWGAFAARYGTADAFFRDHAVLNYCPLVFMEASGRNRTPDKLPEREREPLFTACDQHLRRVVAALRCRCVVGIGRFAAERAAAVLGDGVAVHRVLHPSPANPHANRGWQEAAEATLVEEGIWQACG